MSYPCGTAAGRMVALERLPVQLGGRHMKRDMVEGSIARAMVAFTVPLMLSGILQQLFNWVDAFIVGNVEGELALAGIGATTALYSLFVMVITGFTGGLSVLAARAYGMGEQGGLSRLLSAFSLLLGSVFTAVAAAVSFVMAGPISAPWRREGIPPGPDGR